MKNLRFKYVVISSPIFVPRVVLKANYMIEHPERYSEEECYRFAVKIIKHMSRRSFAITKCVGAENLPKEGGYIMYSNHQGKYDALGILRKHPKPCAVLWEEKSADRILARQVCGLLRGQTICFTDYKAQIRVLNTIAEEVAAGRKYLIFPEGGYTDNKNFLQDFKSGCFIATTKSKMPIVPVAIYNSYKAMDLNRPGFVRTQVHYLTPIYYDEYKDLNRHELCALVKSRIEERMALLRAKHGGK